MQKGLTPVIGIVLLLLIVISITGFAFFFFGRTLESTQESTEQQLVQKTSQIGQSFRLEGVFGNSVSIRNTGTGDLSMSSLAFFVNNELINATGPSVLTSNKVGTYYLNGSKLAMLPDPAPLKITTGGKSYEHASDFFKKDSAASYNFDEGSGIAVFGPSGIIGNFTGEAFNNGIVYNAQWIDGYYGKALNFDGSGDYIDVTDPADGSLDFGTQSFTLAAWVKTSYNGSGYLRVLTKENPVDRQGYAFYNDGPGSGRMRMFIDDGPLGIANSLDITINDNQWHHVAFVINRTSQVMHGYIDGNIQNWAETGTTSSLSIAGIGNISNSDNLVIGRNANGGQYWNGGIDEVRIYDRALNSTEILEDMNSPYPIERPAASWRFDEGTGTAVNDTRIWVKGKHGAALSFDGVDDYVDVGNDPSLNVSEGFTYSAWIKRKSNSTSQWPYVITYGDTHKYFGLRSLSWGDHIALEYGLPPFDGSLWSSIFIGFLPLNEWHHFLVTYNGTVLKSYKDGNFVSQKNATLITDFDRLRINTGSFNGVIDEVRILNIAQPMD
jgi:flagellin-like protein